MFTAYFCWKQYDAAEKKRKKGGRTEQRKSRRHVAVYIIWYFTVTDMRSSVLSDKFSQISLYGTDDAIAKLYVTKNLVEGNGRKLSHIEL